ncbi:MAG: hypothetical protein HOW73_01385 [Polyangiaceae bacterium]|nr:hypothetical protein [Polyangiaceae bacterium]
MPRSFVAPAFIFLAACNTASASVDPGDLHGVFGGASASASAAAAPSATPRAEASARANASAVVETHERTPDSPDCVEERGERATVVRTLGRPACRGSEVIEWRDPSGAPRYACLFTPPEMSKRDPMPLLVVFHGSTPGLDDPASIPKLTSLRSKMDATDMNGAAPGRGFVMLGVQGRALKGPSKKGLLAGASFDTAHASPDNLDKVATDHFVDELIERGIVDTKRIYAVGMGKGGEMAATYAMLRADRVAAFAAFAPSTPPASWQCPGPPPPAFVTYRACDAVVSCESVESWLRRRDDMRSETKSYRLGEDNREEPNCALKCSKKKGEAHHYRWPKGRENEMLRFLAGYALK